MKQHPDKSLLTEKQYQARCKRFWTTASSMLKRFFFSNILLKYISYFWESSQSERCILRIGHRRQPVWRGIHDIDGLAPWYERRFRETFDKIPLHAHEKMENSNTCRCISEKTEPKNKPSAVSFQKSQQGSVKFRQNRCSPCSWCLDANQYCART